MLSIRRPGRDSNPGQGSDSPPYWTGLYDSGFSLRSTRYLYTTRAHVIRLLQSQLKRFGHISANLALVRPFSGSLPFLKQAGYSRAGEIKRLAKNGVPVVLSFNVHRPFNGKAALKQVAVLPVSPVALFAFRRPVKYGLGLF